MVQDSIVSFVNKKNGFISLNFLCFNKEYFSRYNLFTYLLKLNSYDSNIYSNQIYIQNFFLRIIEMS